MTRAPRPGEAFRVVLVGLGVRGRTWAEVIAGTDGVELSGLVDLDLVRAERIRAELAPDAPASADAGAAFARARPDAIVVATPPRSHHELVRQALEDGVAVLCEKPLSDDLDEVVELVSVARDKAVDLWVGMNFRYLPVSQRIRQFATSGRLGALSHAQFTYLRNRDGRRSDLNDYAMTMLHPLLLEQSIHHFDLIRYCYGSEVRALVADSWRPSWSTYEGDCCASVLFELESGARVSYLGTWTASSNAMSFTWRSDFERGVLIQREQFENLVRFDFEPDLARSGPRLKGPDEAEPAAREALAPCTPFVDDSRALLLDFARAVRGSSGDGTTGRDHLKSVCLVRACVQSIESRSWVALEEVYEEMGIVGAFIAAS